MAEEDYYAILGVARDADASVLKKAFRQAALKYHPDRNPGDAAAEARFKEIGEAYEVLSDPQKRQIYDRYGREGLRGQAGMGGAEDIFSHFSDLFGDLFGGGRGGRARPRQGTSLRIDVEISLLEVLHGVERDITVRRRVPCEPCEGSGAKPGTKPTRCSQCAGRGQVSVNRGFMTMSTTCPRCHGRGETIDQPCPECQGFGQRYEEESLSVKIPKGIDSGMKLRVTGKGEASPNGGPPGDLYVVIDVRPDERFQRQDAELISLLEIDMIQAALGAEVSVPTLEGVEPFQIEPGTQPGAHLKIYGQGLPRLGRPGRGDLHLQVQVKIPTTLSEAQRELLEKFNESAEK